MRASILAFGAGLAWTVAGCCTCRCPEVLAATPPAPPSTTPSAAPPAAPTEPILPTSLGPPTAPAPPSLEAFLESGGLLDASSDRFRAAVEPLRGARVRWQLMSWGGEVTTRGYVTPSGRQPDDLGRVRFVTATLPDAHLGDIWDAGHPVLHCLARFPEEAQSTFVRSDDRREVTSRPDEVVTIEAVIWGVTGGDRPDLWLHDCAVVEAP